MIAFLKKTSLYLTIEQFGMSKIKISIIEDHTEFRKSLAFLLNSNEKYECSAFSNAELFLESILCKQNIPTIIIMDINLPEMDGITCTEYIRKIDPTVLIMICTVYEDDDKIFNALKAGAKGYILKRSPVEHIFNSLEELLQGGSPMSTSIARKVVDSFNKKEKEYKTMYHISAREDEILDLLADGLRLKEIASKLFVSVNTIRTHIRHIYEKLEVQSRVEAINKIKK